MLNKQSVALALIIATGVSSYFILKPFFIAILGAGILAILFRPLFNALGRVISSPSLRATIVLLIALVLISTPFFFLGQALVREGTAIAADIASQNVSGTQVTLAALTYAQQAIELVPGAESVNINAMILEGVKAVGNWVRIQVLALPTKLMLALLTVFLFFFLLRDGHELVRYIFEGLPFSRREQQMIESRLSRTTYAVVYGQIVTAIAQGLIAMLGYYIFGMEAPVLLGLLTIIASLIPVFGTALVWVPASVYLFAMGYSGGEWWQGVGLFLYGMIIINLVDNVLRPLLIGASSRMHTAIALLGVLGGIIVFGFIGVFAGPLILALFITLYDVLIRKDE